MRRSIELLEIVVAEIVRRAERNAAQEEAQRNAA